MKQALQKKYEVCFMSEALMRESFAPVELKRGTRGLRPWSKAFSKEDQPLVDFTNCLGDRLAKHFGLDMVPLGRDSEKGFFNQYVVDETPDQVARMAYLCIEPVLSAGAAAVKKIDAVAWFNALLEYASFLMLIFPQIAFLPMFLTDGWSFIVGYARRSSLGNVRYTLCETSFSLYDWDEETIGCDFSLFWSVCTHPIEHRSTELQISADPPITVKVTKCIGDGDLSFVYEASVLSDPALKDQPGSLYSKLEKLGKFALKVPKEGASILSEGWDAELSAIRVLQQKNLEQCCVFPIAWSAEEPRFIIYPAGAAVYRSGRSNPAGFLPLETKHFAGLLEDLCCLHAAGLLHRNIERKNMILMGDSAKLIDFYCLSPPTTSTRLVGTHTTASQAILEAVLEGKPISYRPEDDLESLLKVFLMLQYRFKVGPVDGLSEIQATHRAWHQKIRACRTEEMTYAKMKEYLRGVFDITEEPWEAHYISRSN